jgi:hypothetical protein
LFTALQVDWFLEVSLHLLFHVIVAWGHPNSHLFIYLFVFPGLLFRNQSEFASEKCQKKHLFESDF